MEGLWRVASVVVVSDPRNRNADPDAAWLAADDELEFTEGLVVQGDDPTNPGGPGGPSLPITLEFLCNEIISGLTLYGFGFHVGDNPYLGAGFTRTCALFGTTSETTAVGTLIEEEVYPDWPGGPRDVFVVLRLDLVRMGAPAAGSWYEPPPGDGTHDPGADSPGVTWETGGCAETDRSTR